MSHFACHMSYVKCLCWSLGHAEQLLFSCVSSKVSICNYVTCHMSHVACHMSHVKCLCWSLGHAEQLLFSCLGWKISVYRWKWQCFFWTSTSCQLSNCPMVQLSKCPTIPMFKCSVLILGTCLTNVIFICRLIRHCLWVKIGMLFFTTTAAAPPGPVTRPIIELVAS